MTAAAHSAANPFALLMDPQAVFRAIENSERLERLHSRVCRPLDKPLLPMAGRAEARTEQVSDDIRLLGGRPGSAGANAI